MAYDPGALEAALSAAVGDEPGLIAELRNAFFESARAHVDALRQSATLADWQVSAARLHNLAASFGARRLMAAATDAGSSSKIDAAQLRRIERAIDALDL